jgi:hypothetical protein
MLLVGSALFCLLAFLAEPAQRRGSLLLFPFGLADSVD